MRYTTLGSSGLRVSEVALGTMTFGTVWGFGGDEEECAAQFDAYASAGGTFLDTADKYTEGHAETILGSLVAKDRDHFVLATKWSLATGDPVHTGGNDRRSLVRSLEASLRRLQTDRIDVYWLHAWDGLTSIDEVVRALDEQVRAGKVLYVGISDAPAWVAARGRTLQELRGWEPFCAVQVQWNLLQRDAERELVPMARALGMGVTAWGPMAGGVLTGKYLEGGDGRYRGSRQSERGQAVVREVVALAGERGVPAGHVALGWLRAQGALPILGARTGEQLVQTLGYLDMPDLTPAELDRLEAVAAPDLGWPHDFLGSSDWTGAGQVVPLV